jgi:hypothetical protein
VANSKYSRVWHRVHVPSQLDAAGIERLVELLPPRARSLAREHAAVIARLSDGHPMVVQRVLSVLYYAEAEGVSDADLKAILGTRGSYE